MTISSIKLASIKRDIKRAEEVLEKNGTTRTNLLVRGVALRKTTAEGYEKYLNRLMSVIHNQGIMPGYQYFTILIGMGGRTASVPHDLTDGDTWIIRSVSVEMDEADPREARPTIFISLHRKTPAGQTDGPVKPMTASYIYDEAFHDVNMTPRTKQRSWGGTSDGLKLANLNGILEAKASDECGIVGSELTYRSGAFDWVYEIGTDEIMIPLAMPRQPASAKRSRKK